MLMKVIHYQKGVVGKIDSTDVLLQKQQVQATIQSLNEKTYDVQPQIKLLEDQLAVQQTQLNNLLKEQQRFQNMLNRWRCYTKTGG